MSTNTDEMVQMMKAHIENQPEHEKIRSAKGNQTLRYTPYELNRWQKYGKDRLYFRYADGYIDLQDGGVKDGAPITNVEVNNIDGQTWVYYYAKEEDIDYEGELLVAARRV